MLLTSLLLAGVSPTLQAQEAPPKRAIDDAFFARYAGIGKQINAPAPGADYAAVAAQVEALRADYEIPAEYVFALEYAGAYCHDQLNHPELAAAHYEKAIAADARDPRPHLKLIDCALRLGDTPTARRELLWVQNQPGLPEWQPWAKRRLANLDWVGKPMPDFTLQDIQGNTLALPDFKDRILVIYCHANWAGTCRDYLPELRRLAGQRKEHPELALLSFSMDRSADVVEALVDKEKLDWPHAWLPQGKESPLALAWKVEFLPTLLLVDGDGVIRYRESPLDYPPEKALESLLSEQKNTRANGTKK